MSQLLARIGICLSTFGLLVLETIVGKKILDFDGSKFEMGLLGFVWSMHERGEKAKVVDERVRP